MSVPDIQALAQRVLAAAEKWKRGWGAFPPAPELGVSSERLEAVFGELEARLFGGQMDAPEAERGNYPFFHPRYAGQMLKPPHPVAVAAYLAAMQVNPNNHALDGGPPTAQMEKEAVADLAAMFGLPGETLGHLTGGGTMANLEALFVARELHPEKGIAFSQDAHYTHGRMAGVLGLAAHPVAADALGRLDLDALETLLKTGQVGTVVVTTGTTGLGAVDRLQDAIPLCRRHGARVHVDAAYGGFFMLLAGEGDDALAPDVAAAFRAIASADSVVIDPHKHGLQPYGCGCVLFRDPSVGRFYRHDSPYTYFTSDALHLGEISLECSRPGAAAAALWTTLKCLPLRADDGLGPIVRAAVTAGRRFAAAVDQSETFRLFAPPELDIVAYAPRAGTLSETDRRSAALFERAMHAAEPVFTSLYRMDAAPLATRWPDLAADLAADAGAARILRSVLMKPEHAAHAAALVDRLAELEKSALL